MRLINADALIPMIKYATTDNEIGVFPIRIDFAAIKEVIDDASTIDAVEVVRCKDCKYQDECEQIVVFDIHVDKVQGHRVDFCSYGKRKGGDNK